MSAARSPMPGLVKAVFVTPGETVRAGDRLAVLEAMKMEHTLTTARDGVVAVGATRGRARQRLALFHRVGAGQSCTSIPGMLPIRRT